MEVLTAAEAISKTKASVRTECFPGWIDRINKAIDEASRKGNFNCFIELRKPLPTPSEIPLILSLLDRAGFRSRWTGWDEGLTIEWKMETQTVESGIKVCSYCKAGVISENLKNVLACPVCGANL
jgi:hypothetical protein